MNVTGKLLGAEDVKAEMTRLKKAAAPTQLRKPLREVAKRIAARARNNAPVATGRLRKSIVVRNARSRSKTEGAIEVAAKAPYAWVVEYGTSKRAAHPFLRPATGGADSEVGKAIEQHISEAKRS